MQRHDHGLAGFLDADRSLASTGLNVLLKAWGKLVTLVVYKGEVKKQYIKPFESTADIEKAVEEALA